MELFRERMCLLSSYARGEAEDDSDVDIYIDNREFEKFDSIL